MVDLKPISDLFDFSKGSLQSSKCTPGKFRFITAAEDWKTHNTYSHDCEALIFAMAASGSLGRTHYVNGKFISSDLCFILTPKKSVKLDLIFYHRLFNFLRIDIVKRLATGTSKLAINQTNFGAYKLPYFDYSHQLQFRGKIEKILALNNKFLAEIDMQLDFLPKLRQQILQDAIKGKLTADWRKKNPALITGENHASKLLEKIKSEKSRLIQQGKLKKEKPLPPITEAEKPFPLPEGWVWCRLDGDIAHVSTGATPLTSHKEYYNGGTLNWVTSSATNDLFICSSEKLITEKAIRETNCKIFPIGTLIIAMYGQGKTRGQISELNISAATNQACAALELYYCNETLKRYLKIFFLQQYDKLRALAFGGLQPNLNLTKIGETMIPLPPYEEQKRILVGVDNAMNRLDGLEKQCAERQSQSKMLMQSVLREAFETPVAENKHPFTKEQ